MSGAPGGEALAKVGFYLRQPQHILYVAERQSLEVHGAQLLRQGEGPTWLVSLFVAVAVTVPSVVSKRSRSSIEPGNAGCQ